MTDTQNKHKVMGPAESKSCGPSISPRPSAALVGTSWHLLSTAYRVAT